MSELELSNKEMEVYFSRKTIDCQIPENILTEIRNTFTKFEIETCMDGTIKISVPKEEVEIIKEVKKDFYKTLKNVKERNSVLAGKLARKHRL